MEHSILDSKEFTHSITSYWSKSLAHARIHTHCPATFCSFSKTRKWIQNKIPSTFYPAKVLIDNSTFWTPSSWFRKPKSEIDTPSSPSWINATLVFSRISHSVQPVGKPAVATWQAFAQHYFFKQHTLWKASLKDGQKKQMALLRKHCHANSANAKAT